MTRHMMAQGNLQGLEVGMQATRLVEFPQKGSQLNCSLGHAPGVGIVD